MRHKEPYLQIPISYLQTSSQLIIMKKIYLLAKNYFQVSIAFPFSILIWTLITFVEPIVMLTIWQQVAKSGGELPFSLSQIVTYYILSTLYYRIMQVWSLGKLSREVYRGNFSNLLLLHIRHRFIFTRLFYQNVLLDCMKIHRIFKDFYKN